MAHLQFTDVQARPTEFLDFTSLTLDEFQLLVPPFEASVSHLLHEAFLGMRSVLFWPES